ncbi:hypothetical protein AB0F11_34040 [Streptomyces sp. NPDC032472]|uniref:terpene synthase family protein n=1 Tax=Streptomyces sp. NPDC032472 TaxID=3155018 RepID=UPI003402D109
MTASLGEGTPNAIPAEMLAFYCPFDEEVNPQAETLRERTLAWAERYDLGEGNKARTVQFALTGSALIAHCYPHARGELAQALSDYSAWAWLANDHVGRARPSSEDLAEFGRWGRIMCSPDSWPSSQRPGDAALRDSFLRLRECMTPVQWQRFVVPQAHWLYGMAWESALHEKGGESQVNDYLATRITSGGALASPGYLDAVEGIELDERQWARHDVRAATEALMTAAALDNDRYSHLKERKMESRKHNLFDVLRREHPDYSRTQAIHEGIAVIDRFVNLYLALRDQILPDASADLKRYLTAVERIFSGNFSFCVSATRYLRPDQASAISRTTVPSVLGTAPLPYPTVAWWWDQLT